MQADLNKIKTGGVEDFSNFVNAVIDEASFDKLAKAIDDAQASPDAEVILGGKYDKSKGYFIYPTVIQAKKPDYITMREELFGPVLTNLRIRTRSNRGNARPAGCRFSLCLDRSYFLQRQS